MWVACYLLRGRDGAEHRSDPAPPAFSFPRGLITGRPWLLGRALGRQGTIRDIEIKLCFLGWGWFCDTLLCADSSLGILGGWDTDGDLGMFQHYPIDVPSGHSGSHHSCFIYGFKWSLLFIAMPLGRHEGRLTLCIAFI